MKRLTRIVFAVIATFTLLFINVGAFTMHAFAWEDSKTWNTAPSWNNEPTWKTPPKWESPKWKSSGWNTQPSWKTSPNWQNPGWESSPNWQNPGWENQPSWENQPNWQSPGWENQPSWGNQPNWNEPNWKDPNWQNSGSNQPPGQNSDGSNSHDPTSPDGLQPNVPGDQNSPIPPNDQNNPQSKDQTNNQVDSDKDNKNNTNKDNADNSTDDSEAPFWDFKPVTDKDAIKFIAKDIVGGNIEFISKGLNENLTLEDYLKNRNKMGISGFKLITKGDPTVGALYDGYDLVKKSKETYDKYKTYKSVKELDNLRKAGNLIEYARQTQELAEAGKSFSAGNPVVSAITMPLTIWDTVDNVNKLNNAKTAEEKTDAKWGLVDNAGSFITGAAPFVAMIPGAQPIAAGMIVVGTAISAVSLGRKLWKNRKEIWENVTKKGKKAWNWLTSKFKG
ncbi:hypothetical protein [Cytobacillus dafuensis]|uniref:Uncharacterized protein n=1 Tax=Cytobacillus dafuensis TaxID=1742359 RepID=A0A5B8Z0H3_CYTDA|nr:hypothetical protein [Cytobacillus dafuensis]QED46420.1 hypothetical protein FSZ17_03575 [Cytobacillus dafuensis]